MLAAKYPENVELLGCDTEKRKELLLVANKPVGCIDKVYHRLLVDAMEDFLLDFVFDLHEQGERPPDYVQGPVMKMFSVRLCSFQSCTRCRRHRRRQVRHLQGGCPTSGCSPCG